MVIKAPLFVLMMAISLPVMAVFVLGLWFLLMAILGILTHGYTPGPGWPAMEMDPP
jgi:hypothetical protein